MNIQSKLAFTYITLLSLGVIVISSYAILSIRAFLLEEGIVNFEEDAQVFAKSFEDMDPNENLFDKALFVSNLTGYEIALFDSEGQVLVNIPDALTDYVDAREYLNDDLQDSLNAMPGSPVVINEELYPKLIAFQYIGENSSEARYLRISQLKSTIYAAEASIRHLIYGAMVGSILVVIIVSFYFARYMSKPLLRLKEAALDIANGNLDREINLKRSDEFGTLARSLNQMADTLRADTEQLKKLNEKQNQFFADITHEVRNPLHSISGALEMMELENLEASKKAQYIQVARKQLQRVTRLFEDLKTLQRYDYDASFIIREQVELGKLVEGILHVHKPFAEKKGIELVSDIEENLNVFVDPDKIEQVIENLTSNALKYTNEGTVTVAAKKVKEGVKVSVSDTGIGISDEHLERLFDRFYRADKARSRDKGGTGLGLAVVKSILTAHQSDIQVESTVGKGSTFQFVLKVR
jgi:signal transduction histidine kinase